LLQVRAIAANFLPVYRSWCTEVVHVGHVFVRREMAATAICRLQVDLDIERPSTESEPGTVSVGSAARMPDLLGVTDTDGKIVPSNAAVNLAHTFH
jgi:hypothetical protein